MDSGKTEKFRIPPYVFVLALAVIMGCMLFSSGAAARLYARAVEHAVEAVPADQTEIALNDLIPFEWDEVYSFEPYTTREEIEQIIGLHSGAIGETVSEDMVQYVFVNREKGKVKASICGRPVELGYRFVFPEEKRTGNYCKVTKADQLVFDIGAEKGVTVLTARGQ